jgi:xanthine dehydrogenase YagT iron-sulfur-binding subunit
MDQDDDEEPNGSTGSFTRREFVGVAVTAATLGLTAGAASVDGADATSERIACTLNINGQKHSVQLDSRTTLLDLLREQLQLTGTKKGCDHGQCGACTVIVNGRRINSCLSLALMNEGNEIVTIEGLAPETGLHPMQAAFVEHDGLQCGYCTPGQICSAVAMLQEVKSGAPSAVTGNLAQILPIELNDDEIRERMSGNICRCAAYVGIVAAIREVAQGNRG